MVINRTMRSVTVRSEGIGMAGVRKKDPEMKRGIISFVNSFFIKNHRSPYMSEISAAVGLSKSNVHAYITELAAEGRIEYDGRSIVTDVIRKIDTDTRLVPIVGRIACGNPREAEENIEEFVALPTILFGKEDSFILRASGESMIGAGIEDGDMVIIKRRFDADEGNIVAFMTKEYDATLKRIHYEPDGRIVLHPENPAFKDIIIDDPDDCMILGVAESIIKML